jgi:flagellin-specific chaperone FliS
MMDPKINYVAESATGVTPLGLVVRLYETVISDLGRAITAVRDGDVEIRTFELQHALAIIGHLQGALDMIHGGDPAVLLDRFYALARTRIFDSQLHQSGKPLEELIRDFIVLRDAWTEVEKSLPPATPPPGGPDNSGQWVA